MFRRRRARNSSSTNCFDKLQRQYVVKVARISLRDGGESRRRRRKMTRTLERVGAAKGVGSAAGRREGGLERGRRRGGLSKFRLNSPRINIRNGTPGCHKLACCPLLSFPDSTICTPGPVTVYHKLRLFFIIVLPVDIEKLQGNFDYGRSRNFTLSR